MSESSADRPAYDCPVSAVEVLRGLHDLQSTGTLCDVVLKGSEGYAAGIPCHRNILIVHSAFFRAAFTGADWKESSQKVFPLHHIDTQTLKELVEYAYTLEISLNGDNVAPVLIAAQFLQMTPVARLCWEYVEKHMCLSNCLAVYALASQHHNPRLAYTALDLVHSNFPRFAQSQEFLQMNEQQLIALIASDEVEVFCEDEVWEAVLRWLEYDRPGRLEHVPAVLQMVRAAFLSDQSCLAYSEVLASAMPPCQSAMAAKELPIEEIENFRPRPSYGAQEVVLCVGGGGGTTVEVFSPSIPAVWCFSDLPISAQSCRAVQLDACTVMVAHFNGCNTLRRDCRYMGPLGEWCKVAPVLTRRRDEGLAALSGRIYAAGGFSHGYESDPLTSVEAYNPESNA
ncbi:kelch-like protein 17 [Paramacrobiotus metropolitanus]|uniref:kelch-like protein 17 n=1 Tax=Paramacrobiotus metropolitanus TaxID=2943436 RepID=UPI0024459BF6|nr:kelch-like protein 17 [Paramacrobiotus metropolitanus]